MIAITFKVLFYFLLKKTLLILFNIYLIIRPIKWFQCSFVFFFHLVAFLYQKKKKNTCANLTLFYLRHISSKQHAVFTAHKVWIRSNIEKKWTKADLDTGSRSNQTYLKAEPGSV